MLSASGIYLIADKGKPLDFIGGAIEEGETPDVALIREIMEESNITVTAADFLPLGVTEDETDKYLWRSYVYVMKVPKELEKTLVKFELDVATLKRMVAANRPQFQPWVYRHLSYLHEFGDLIGLKSLLVLAGKAPLFRGLEFPTELCRAKAVGIGFVSLLLRIYHQSAKRDYESYYRETVGFIIPPYTDTMWRAIVSASWQDMRDKVMPDAMDATPIVIEPPSVVVSAYPNSVIVAKEVISKCFVRRNVRVMAKVDFCKELEACGYPGVRSLQKAFVKKCVNWGLISVAGHQVSIVSG